MDVKEIITKYLKDNGYDGLFNPDGECACLIADLVPCSELSEKCESGYKTKCDCEDEDGCYWMGSGHDWHISREREKPDGEE